MLLVKSRNMKRVKYIVVLLMIGAMMSCGNDNLFMRGAKVKAEVPAKVVNIFGEKIPLDLEEDVFLSPFVVNDSIVILNSIGQGSVPLYRANIIDGSVVPILLRGRGPSEMLLAQVVKVGKDASGRDVVYLYDINTAKMNILDIEASASKRSGVFTSSFSIPERALNLFMLDDGFLQKVNNGQGHLLYRKFDRGFNLLEEYDLYGSGITQDGVVTSCECVSPAGNRLFLGMFYFDKANFLSLDSSPHFSVVTDKGQNNFAEKEMIRQIEETKSYEGLDHYYLSCKNGGDYIFTRRDPGNVIRIFRWDGTILADVTLDRQISSFGCSQDGKTVYAFDTDFKFYKYDFSDIL